MLQLKPGRKTPTLSPITKAILLQHMQDNALSIPALALKLKISKHVLYNILSSRSGMTEEVELCIQAFVKKEAL